jgi:cytidine deaminase
MSHLFNLLQAALAAREHAYAPYSGFCVGAAILDEHAQIHAGCNVENVSYPCGTCAEAGAVAAMIAGGGRLIQDIVIVADSQNLISPCGACRQRIAEFSDEHTKIHLADLGGIRKTYSVCDLLPCSFADFKSKEDSHD